MNYLNTNDTYILFGKVLRGEIYVDKSMLIDKISKRIGTNNQYVCITRPRRFGKSVNIHMLGSYYTKGQDLVETYPFLNYNDENSLSCVITLCYLYARRDYYIEREEKSGKGYCDYLFLPKKKGKPAIILELKVNDSCENALLQIKEKNYLQKTKERAEEVLFVGIAYDKGKKRHECVIERA